MAQFLSDTSEGLRIAATAVRANPLRSALTMLGIIIGIVTVTLMGAFLIGISDMFHSTVSFMGTDVYYIDKFNWSGGKNWMLQANRPAVTYHDAEELRRWMTTARAVSVSADEWGNDAKSRYKTVQSI